MYKIIGEISSGKFNCINNSCFGVCRFNFDFTRLSGCFDGFFSNRQRQYISALTDPSVYCATVSVYVLNAAEMKKAFGKTSNAKTILKKMKDLLERNHAVDTSLYKALKENSEDSYNYIREILDEAKNELEDELYHDIIGLFSTIFFDTILFGVYLHNGSKYYPDGIYLCPENILDECRICEGRISIDDLMVSVLVHEYTHFLHINSIGSYKRLIGNNKICRSAVLETVAESIEALFIRDKLSYSCFEWIQKHSEGNKKMFPGWGYKGWSIIEKYCSFNDFYEEELIAKIIALSLKDWKDAYVFINTIYELNLLHQQRTAGCP